MTPAPSSDKSLPKATRSILIYADSTLGPTWGKALSGSTHNCETLLVTDALRVMSQLLHGKFDLLLIDADMTASLDAETITRQVRFHFSPVQLPVIILADDHTIEKRNSALAAGANSYLSKPFDANDVLLRISNHLALGDYHKSNRAIRSQLESEVKARTAKLNMLIDSGLMMSMEKSRAKLLNHILVEGQRLLNCDGGTMYLVTQQNTLSFAVRTREDLLPFREIPLYDAETGLANEAYASTYAAIHKETINIDDVYQETRFDCSGTRDFNTQSGYRTVSVLTVPMAPRNGDVIGILQFINALDPDTGAIIPFPDDMVVLVEALAAQAAVALDNLQLVEGQKTTTENLIKVLAAAIDTKSLHTGHHCVRVPELALMLADAACKATQGSLVDFNFNSDDEWFEFRVGAWLHDCGKIMTPEHVIDKATKLDCIYNRIHEIRMRFEVLLRDAKIVRLETLLNGGDVSEANALFERQKTELLSDFAFVAECNLGKEKMDPAQIERIKTVAQTTWQRHFDDRLGLSLAESARRRAESDHELPVQEFLLSDKWQHIILRDPDQLPDPALSIAMAIPEHLYNHGEIYNLTVQKGTLTTEEKYKVNEHMLETIKMLEQVPFPESLNRVPEYATTHHETLNGQGYPRRLTAESLSIPARIMAIADIFEALTSSNRPYKAAYTLSKAMKILHGMKKDQHIDPDLFDLFLTSGVYRDYAEQFLSPEQIDDVDIHDYLGPVHP